MPKPGEFFVIGGDCSQGGDDTNESHFFSVTDLDFPIVYTSEGVAAAMTNAVFPWLEWVCDLTGIIPVVAFERQNGGASEMYRMEALNKKHKYEVFKMPRIGSDKEEQKEPKFGWDTNAATRPKLVSDWKIAVDGRLPTIYEEDAVSQHRTFVVNKEGKPEAARGSHDDKVIAPAIAWQLFQICTPKIFIPIQSATQQAVSFDPYATT